MKIDKKTAKIILWILIIAIIVFTVAQNLGAIFNGAGKVLKLLSTVLAGLSLAFILNLILRLFENRIFKFMGKAKRKIVRKLHRPVSLVLTLILSFGFLSLLVIVILPPIVETFTDLVDNLGEYAHDARLWIEGLLAKLKLANVGLPEFSIDWDAVGRTIMDFIQNGNIIGAATGVTTGVVGGVIDTVFAVVIAIYVLAQKERIGGFMRRLVIAIFPNKVSGEILRIARLTNETFANFITGQFLESIILGILCYIGMLIFRFPYPEIIAVVIGVTSFVPMVGSFIGEVIGAFLILLISPIKAVLFIVFILCLQQIEGSFIYPKVVGKQVGLPGVLVLIAVIIGGKFSGVAGSLLSVPVCAVLYTLLREFMDRRLAKKQAAGVVISPQDESGEDTAIAVDGEKTSAEEREKEAEIDKKEE